MIAEGGAFKRLKQVSMEAAEKKLNEVLTEGHIFQIPDYQRPYSWEEKHIEQLLEDLKEAFDRNDEEYFIGALILIKGDKTHHEVVDGQQRITTLTIVLSVIRDLLTDAVQKNHVQQRLLPQNPLNKKISGPRLVVRSQDRAFFQDAILMGKEYDEESELSDSQTNMLRNKKYAQEFFKNYSQTKLADFVTFLENNVWIVWVAAVDKKSAFRMFNVLNARGLPLSNGDLIKNFLYGELQKNEHLQVAIKDAWDELEDIIGLKEMDTFLGHYRTSHQANKADKTLYEEFETLYKKLDESADDFARTLVSAAGIYKRILDNQLAGGNSVKRSIVSLQRVSYDEWIPPLLAFLEQKVKGITLEEYLGNLEKITYQNWIRRLGRAKRNTIYYQLINQIRKNKPAAAILETFKENSNNKELSSFLDGELYRMPYAKAVLMRLEDAEQDDSVAKIYSSTISVEHVLPQTPTDKYWLKRFDEVKAKELVHKLGNLTLLSGKKNSSAQNYDFKKKKAVYEKKNDKVSFDMTKKVIEQDDWNEEIILNRQKKMVSTALKIWSIK